MLGFIGRKIKVPMLILAILLAVWGGYLLNDKIHRRKTPVFSAVTFDDIKNPMLIYNKMLVSEAIVSQVKREKKLIVMETEVFSDVIFDDSYLDWAVLSKTQKITYYATGSFTVDLSSFDEKKFTVDYDNRRITVRIPGPDLNSLAIIDEKTVYQDVDLGLLRFGDIKLRPIEYDLMVAYAKEHMREQLQSPEIAAQAQAMAIQAVREIVAAVLSGADPLAAYEIIVEVE